MTKQLLITIAVFKKICKSMYHFKKLLIPLSLSIFENEVLGEFETQSMQVGQPWAEPCAALLCCSAIVLVGKDL